MGNRYVLGNNPFQDFLLQYALYDVDLSDKKMKDDIHAAFTIILKNILNNENDAVYLDFDIIGEKNNIKIIGKNAISAVWLSGFFVENPDQLLKNNKFRIGNRGYTYNTKTFELTYIEIDE